MNHPFETIITTSGSNHKVVFSEKFLQKPKAFYAIFRPDCTGWVPPKVPLLTTLRGRAISYLRPGPLGPGHSVVDHIPSRSVHL